MAKQRKYKKLLTSNVPSSRHELMSNLDFVDKREKSLALFYASPPMVRIFLEYLRLSPSMQDATLRNDYGATFNLAERIKAMQLFTKYLGSDKRERDGFFKEGFDEARSIYFNRNEDDYHDNAIWLARFMRHAFDNINDWNIPDKSIRRHAKGYYGMSMYDEIEQRTGRRIPDEFRYLPTDLPSGLERFTCGAIQGPSQEKMQFENAECERFNHIWNLIIYLKMEFGLVELEEWFVKCRDEENFKNYDDLPWWNTPFESSIDQDSNAVLKHLASSKASPTRRWKEIASTFSIYENSFVKDRLPKGAKFPRHGKLAHPGNFGREDIWRDSICRTLQLQTFNCGFERMVVTTYDEAGVVGYRRKPLYDDNVSLYRDDIVNLLDAVDIKHVNFEITICDADRAIPFEADDLYEVRTWMSQDDSRTMECCQWLAAQARISEHHRQQAIHPAVPTNEVRQSGMPNTTPETGPFALLRQVGSINEPVRPSPLHHLPPFENRPEYEPINLLSLPSEIRSRIYHLVVVEDQKIRLDITRSAPPETDEVVRFNNRFKQFRVPAIAHTCKETRLESLLQFYHCNDFVIVADATWSGSYARSSAFLLHEIFMEIRSTPHYGEEAIIAIGFFELLAVRWSVLQYIAQPIFGRVFLTHPAHGHEVFSFSRRSRQIAYDDSGYIDSTWVCSERTERSAHLRFNKLCLGNGFLHEVDDASDDYVRGKATSATVFAHIRERDVDSCEIMGAPEIAGLRYIQDSDTEASDSDESDSDESDSDESDSDESDSDESDLDVRDADESDAEDSNDVDDGSSRDDTSEYDDASDDE